LTQRVSTSFVQNFAFYGNPPLTYAHPLLVKHKKKFPSVFGGHPPSMNIRVEKRRNIVPTPEEWEGEEP
jgi:hypothetical protein